MSSQSNFLLNSKDAWKLSNRRRLFHWNRSNWNKFSLNVCIFLLFYPLPPPLPFFYVNNRRSFTDHYFSSNNRTKNKNKEKTLWKSLSLSLHVTSLLFHMFTWQKCDLHRFPTRILHQIWETSQTPMFTLPSSIITPSTRISLSLSSSLIRETIQIYPYKTSPLHLI